MEILDQRGPSAYVRSVLAPGAVAILVGEQYGLEVTDCALLRSLVNEVYAVTTSTDRYAFKLYRQENAPGARTVDEVGWEQQLVVTLAAAGVPVPAPVVRHDGSLVGAHSAPEGLRPFALTRWIEGSKPSAPYSDGLYRAFGALTARFHTVADGTAVADRRLAPDAVGELLTTAAEIAEHLGPDDAALVSESAVRAAGDLGRLPEQDLTWGVRHGDVTLDNILVGPLGHLGLHDFDRSGAGWLAADLTGVRATERWPAFLTGYSEHRRLTSADLQAIPLLQVAELVANLRFHLVHKVALFGTETRGEGWVERELASLRKLARQRPPGLHDTRA